MRTKTTLLNKNLASEAEELGKLPKQWLQYIYENNSFKLFVPQALGGTGYTLPEVLKMEEKLSQIDGSLGWTVTLCAGAAWFVGFLDLALAKEVFSNPEVCLAGSGFVGGEANLINGEYHINGSWTYASGALHATHFTANCKLLENSNLITDEKGAAVVKAFILKKEEVEILDGWSYMGMVATGSHAFKVAPKIIPFNRCFEILPEKATLQDPVFQYPFLQLAETTLVANVLGITLHFIALVEECFWIRNQSRAYGEEHLQYFIELLKSQQQCISNFKNTFYEKVDQSWEELLLTGKINIQILKEVSQTSRDLAIICRKAAAELHPFSGLEAAKKHTEINRVWRDMNTVSQHALLIFPF